MKKLMFLSAAALMLTACAAPGTYVGSGWFAFTKQPILATTATGTRVGRACGRNILGVYIDGDMSVETAKKNGRITQVASIDREIKSYAVYSEVCTVVTGR